MKLSFRDPFRHVRTVVLCVALAGLSACSSSDDDRAERPAGDARDSLSFPVPQQIVVGISPYGSIEQALADQANIDWGADDARAQAITLAFAASELRDLLAKAGVPMSISTTERVRPSPGSIVLAVTEQISAREDMPRLAGNPDRYGAEGYTVAPFDGSLYIVANARKGVLNGAYRLLDYLGFRWYDAYETQVPPTFALGERITWARVDEAPRVDLRGFWIYRNEPISDETAIWLARNRLNIGGAAREPLKQLLGLVSWAGDHEQLQQEFSRPGLFEQHPEWYGEIDGTRRPVDAAVDYVNPAFANREAAVYFADRLIDRLEHGDLRGVDILNVWPSDSRFNRFDQSAEARALGNDTDNLLYFYANVLERFGEARADGRLSRDVRLAGISYFLTMAPPGNSSIVARLEPANYLHIFYLIDRDWSGPIDTGLENRDTNRRIIESLAAWRAAANLTYGVDEYHNFSGYAGVGLSDAQHLAHNLHALTQGRDGLLVSQHPLDVNPGPRRLTYHLLAQLPWQEVDSQAGAHQVAAAAERLTANFFAARYGDSAAEWREISELMATSVDNAKMMFGIDSLLWLLFQDLTWGSRTYTGADLLSFIARYRAGGIQEVPTELPTVRAMRETFRGLDESVQIQQAAQVKWLEVLEEASDPEARRRMQEDVEWFLATASRYRLMVATCDYVIAREQGVDASEPRARSEAEIAFLSGSPVLADSLSRIDQRAFLDLHRALLEMP